MADINQRTADTLTALACKNFAALLTDAQAPNNDTCQIPSFWNGAFRGSLATLQQTKSQWAATATGDLLAAVDDAIDWHQQLIESGKMQGNAIARLLLVSIALLPPQFTAPSADQAA
jgi:hypothetical protein